MKAGIHPEYRKVVFQDVSSDFAFLTRSTIESSETIKWEDGEEYPLVKVEISSASQPRYSDSVVRPTPESIPGVPEGPHQ